MTRGEREPASWRGARGVVCVVDSALAVNTSWGSYRSMLRSILRLDVLLLIVLHQPLNDLVLVTSGVESSGLGEGLEVGLRLS